jgi:hypothetical protein
LFSIFVALRPGVPFFTINLERCIRLSTSEQGNSNIDWVTWNNKNIAHNTSSTKRKEDYPLSWFVSAFLAKIMSTSAKVLLPIQRFCPSKCQPPGTFQNNNNKTW